jgi:hypothetical protein
MTAIDPQFLREEYFQLQKTVEDFDQRALTIKAWSVTLSMAGIGAAFIQKTPSLVVLAGMSSVLFWIVEALWKTSQQAYYHRIHSIEAHMRGEKIAQFSSPAIASSWSVGYRHQSIFRIMSWPHVAMPHVVVALFGVVTWLLDLFLKFLPR